MFCIFKIFRCIPRSKELQRHTKINNTVTNTFELSERIAKTTGLVKYILHPGNLSPGFKCCSKHIHLLSSHRRQTFQLNSAASQVEKETHAIQHVNKMCLYMKTIQYVIFFIDLFCLLQIFGQPFSTGRNSCFVFYCFIHKILSSSGVNSPFVMFQTTYADNMFTFCNGTS